jgi:hypothetical protein
MQLKSRLTKAVSNVHKLGMKQFNLNLDPEFELKLARYMRAKNIAHKSQAIKLAVSEALELTSKADLRALLGAALNAPLNSEPLSEDDLWS